MPAEFCSIDFRNTNSLWASVAVETLARLGLQTAILCPGSRSTPLTFAFANHPSIEALPILDERSAAFFALGCAKQQHLPVALVCTSGTAGANFYPAIIEAYESGIPLLVFTADRPPEMRDCGSGQTIDQQKLYGQFAKHYSELAVPVAELDMLAYLRQTLVSSWSRAIAPQPGPIHFNCPFRDPLPPIPDGKTQGLETIFKPEQFFANVLPPRPPIEQAPLPAAEWQACARGVIIAGPASPKDPQTYCQAIAQLAQWLGWPVLAEGLSPLRNYRDLNPTLVSAYDGILRDPDRASFLIPEIVIQLGPLPISKVLRQWLQATQPQRWVIGTQRNLDPLHGPARFLTTEVETLARQLQQFVRRSIGSRQQDVNDYTQQWLTCEKTTRHRIDTQLARETQLVESKVAWLLSQHLPEHAPLFIANSMPVRDVEYFWQPNNRQIRPAFSRGANGIDGTLSTAMGWAHRHQPAVLLTGDLAFLHDTNGLSNAPQLAGHLTVVLIDNQGGGIFEMLPVAQFEPTFEKYFVMPQQVNFSALCQAYGADYRQIESAEDLIECLRVLPETGIRLLVVRCDRKHSARQRKALLNSL